MVVAAPNDCEAAFDSLKSQCAKAGKSPSQRAKLLRNEPSGEAVPGENTPDRLKRIEQAKYQRAQELLRLEQLTASPLHSPGTIKSEEKVRRALLEGDDVHGFVLAASAFSDIEGSGLSMYRDLLPVEKCRDLARKLETEERSFKKYVDIDVAFLRAQTASLGKISQIVRCVAVYDTALPGEEAHAEAFLIARETGNVPYKNVLTNIKIHCERDGGGVKEWPKA